MESKENIKTSTSWKAVILWMIFFWPVGIYLLYKKISSDKSAVLQNSKTLGIIGYVFIGISVIYMIMAITGEVELSEGSSLIGTLLISTLFFGGGGVVMVLIANKMKMKATNFKKYINMIVNNNQNMIEDIAAAIPTTYEEAVKDLQEMIDKGYFAKAYIDASRRKFVLPLTQEEKDNSEIKQKAHYKMVTCKNCDGLNKIIHGEKGHCAFCDSIIE